MRGISDKIAEVQKGGVLRGFLMASAVLGFWFGRPGAMELLVRSFQEYFRPMRYLTLWVWELRAICYLL